MVLRGLAGGRTRQQGIRRHVLLSQQGHRCRYVRLIADMGLLDYDLDHGGSIISFSAGAKGSTGSLSGHPPEKTASRSGFRPESSI